MKITIKHYGIKYSVKTDHDDLTLVDTMDLIKELMTSIYCEKLVNEYWDE